MQYIDRQQMYIVYMHIVVRYKLAISPDSLGSLHAQLLSKDEVTTDTFDSVIRNLPNT